MQVGGFFFVAVSLLLVSLFSPIFGQGLNVYSVCRRTWVIENPGASPVDVTYKSNFDVQNTTITVPTTGAVIDSRGPLIQLWYNNMTQNATRTDGKKCLTMHPLCQGRFRVDNPFPIDFAFSWSVTKIDPLTNALQVESGSGSAANRGQTMFTSNITGTMSKAFLYLNNVQVERKRGSNKACPL
eukprot:TRINITY_DN864_c0_g1_i1.p1 TRINITY_DN864_c0_g1~~TRINITY_DN864_c0_g1_i1.p1  ORF type:complete len:184 (+),score=56.34 TRINITY_DN864_c0_g1_i1:148-699(+)